MHASAASLSWSLRELFHLRDPLIEVTEDKLFHSARTEPSIQHKRSLVVL